MELRDVPNSINGIFWGIVIIILCLDIVGVFIRVLCPYYSRAADCSAK